MNMNSSDMPLISIGMPVYNSELTIRAAIDSLLQQSYKNLELIISDNCSIDSTELICQEYARYDRRIKYIRQLNNIGSALNFKFVLERASGKYFMWAAGDDVRASDFLFENLKVLERNSNFVASTSLNCFEGQEATPENWINFSLEGDVFERYKCFFDNCWKSHGILYSLIRTSVLKDCDVIGQSFIAQDWAINLYLASRGEVSRVKKGLVVFGAHGISSKKNAYRAFQNHPIEIFFPFYRLSCYVFKLSKPFTLFEKIYLLRVLVKLNLKATYDQVYAFLYEFYCLHLKPLKKIS